MVKYTLANSTSQIDANISKGAMYILTLSGLLDISKVLLIRYLSTKNEQKLLQ